MQVVSLEDSFVPSRIGLVCLSHFWSSQTCSDSDGDGPVVLEDNEIAGGENLLAALQGSLDVSKEVGTLAATLKAAMHNLLIKQQYSVEKRELRKKE